jgi:hypothetical protein
MADKRWPKQMLQWMLPGSRNRERQMDEENPGRSYTKTETGGERTWSKDSGWTEENGDWDSEDVSGVKKPVHIADAAVFGP